MSDIITPPSFYRFYPEKQYKPTLFQDKDPIRAETNNHTINWKPQKVKQIKEKSTIKVEDIEQQWKSGVYNTKDHFNSHPFSTESGLKKYYHDVNLTQELPLYVPSNKIFLNNDAGIAKQWKIYAESNSDEF